ncbi:winged helix-turn-helix transcriptional regulator [Halalkalicoccus sp. NIPERK01]|uniref:winged helix-turn-helix transcriptional regulator n=1 Tax=Halalkalicoccus sp. NIPERK01 TaxID=3053469 RepID=UPI00256ED60B|nr:winged helix-turn-helix transcriptional regulator [Halalkalicoccus sp. NIPERK01]MDL5361852.1 winged helix-turn-helix transcriptional regulator [Halalkalicoccus sp. NIPERK01]
MSSTNETRRRVREHVHSQPGIHFNALVRDSAFAPDQIQYHLRRLLRAGEVAEERLYGRTHYFPPEHDAWERRTLALVRRETAREVLTHLLEHEGAKPAAVADSLGIARSTLEWHLGRLEEQGIVGKDRDERNRVTLFVSHPDRTARLLAETTDSLPDRFADRFMRLVDDLFEE